MAWDTFLWRSGNVGLERLRADAEANKSKGEKVGDFVMGAVLGAVGLIGVAAIVAFMLAGKRRSTIGKIAAYGAGGVGLSGIWLGLTQFVGANQHRYAGVVAGAILTVLGGFACYGISQVQQEHYDASVLAHYGLHAVTPEMTRQQLVDELNVTEEVNDYERGKAAVAGGCTYHGCLESHGDDENIVEAHKYEIERALAASAPPETPRCNDYRDLDLVNNSRWVLCR